MPSFILFRENLDYLFSAFSFLPKSEKCTYRFGCACKSSKREAALAVVALKLLYKVGSLKSKPTVLSLLFNLLVSSWTLNKVESIFWKVSA